VCAVGLALTPVAWAAEDPVLVEGDNNGGYVDTTVTAPSTEQPAAGGGGATAAAQSDDGVSCTWTEWSDYTQSLWDWVGAGDPEGRWYDVRCSDGAVYLGVYVPPASDSVPPEVQMAGALARTVLNRLQLPEPAVGQSPADQALVGLPTWWWVQPGSWRVLQQRTTAGPVWAEVTATPVSTSWDPGDGSAPLVCAGPGTPYDRSRPESAQSTDCSYTYRRSSANEPQTGPDANDRFFTVTVTTTWQVSWRGAGGSGGQLPALTRTSSFPVAVAQRQTVVTGGSG
jgi:hypothetical protein